MIRVASLYLPMLPIERLRRLERPRAQPERAAPLPLPIDDDPGACSVPRGGGWRPGARWAVEGGERVLSTMKWGFPTRKPRKRPAREGELPFLYDWWTNCRNLTSNMWRPWLLKPEHRCLVPFARFAEPKAVGDRSGPRDLNWWFTVND